MANRVSDPEPISPVRFRILFVRLTNSGLQTQGRSGGDQRGRLPPGMTEAITVFADPLAKILDDPDHSRAERRELIVGHSSEQRLLVVSFTERVPRIRIIGARITTASERKAYEEHTEKNSGV